MRAPSLLSLAVASLWATCSPLAQAQSLVDLYESARAFDAGYLSARLQYDANLARADQALATILPTAGLSAGATRNDLSISPTPANGLNRAFNTETATINASQPLYRPGNWATYEQGKKQVYLARAQLDTAEQDLIVRTSQAYFDVLASQGSLTFVKAQKPPWPSNWPQPNATLKSALRPSRTRAKRKPATTWCWRKRFLPKMICA